MNGLAVVQTYRDISILHLRHGAGEHTALPQLHQLLGNRICRIRYHVIGPVMHAGRYDPICQALPCG